MGKQRKIIAISVGVVLILATLFLITQLSSNLNVQAPAPPREVTSMPLPPPIPSTIAAKVNIPLHSVRQLAESAFRDHFRKPIQWKDGATTASINLHPGTLSITRTSDGAVSVKIPLQISGSVQFPVDLWITVIKKDGTITGQATVSLTLTPTLHADWRITAEIDSDIFIQYAKMRTDGIIAGGTRSIRGIFTRLAKEKFLPQLEEIIAKYIANIDLKTHVAGLWTKLYEPIVLNQEPPITLFMEPSKIFAQQLSIDGATLSLNLGIKTYIQANIGDVPTDFPSPVGSRTDLPDIRFVDSFKSGYHITAPIQVTYAILENLARPHVEKEHKLKSIVLENLTLYGSGTQLAAGAGFRMPLLGTKGQLYLLGTPKHDATTMSLSVTEFNYSFTSQSLLLGIAEGISAGIFFVLRTSVEKELVFPITTLHEKLSAIIAERAIGPHVRLHGTVDTITPEALYLTQTGVRIPFRLQGDLACEITLNSSQVQH